MAKLDQILIKTSDYSEEKLVLAMKGELENVDRPTKVERGEIVIRQADDGRVELWTLNLEGEPKSLSVDISGEAPDYDLEAGLSQCSITLLADVDTSDGYTNGLTSGDAGVVLTWDGGKWVPRPIPEFGEGDALVPSLNEVGDVNYGFYALQNKFGPENGDVLYYLYNEESEKYEWAPTKFSFDLLQEVVVRSKYLVFNEQEIRGIEFGNPVTSKRDSVIFSSGDPGGRNSGAACVAYTHWDQVPGTSTYKKNYTQIQATRERDIKLFADRDIVIDTWTDGKLPSGIRYADVNFVPALPPDDRYLVTLKHVREQVSLTTLGSLADVNDFGILQGQVLGWDSLTQTYIPTSGISPDLSLASIEDLYDFEAGDKSVRGRPIDWDESNQVWTRTQQYLRDIIHGAYTEYDTTIDGEDLSKCPPCNEENLGRFATVGESNERTQSQYPVVCVRTRSQNKNGKNDVFDWVRLLIDGSSRGQMFSTYPPAESSQESATVGRRDPLAPVAYEGDLGALDNVSTADVFPGSSLIYNPASASFEMGFPALDLSQYSINALADVNATNAGVGYGLRWNGDEWTASSDDIAIRLDDLQDVQFGSLGVVNTKMVAAYLMASSRQLPNLLYNQDVSTILAVSTRKENYAPGTTWFLRYDDPFMPPKLGKPVSGFTVFRYDPDIHQTIAEKLDIYCRWPKDESWQTIDGDGCIEMYIYPTELLDNRTLLRRVASSSARGGYILQLMQQGDLRFSVTGPEGYIGFEIRTAFNTVSLNNWHHIAMVKQGGSNRLYFDGELLGEAQSITPWTGDEQLLMGRNDLNDNNTLTHHFYRGYIGDFRVTKGRAKYEGSFYTMPAPLEDEILDTSPQAGDFLSYDGTKWTNVGGVEGDISNKSINDLVDVDTGTTNPVYGDALVWTGAIWEPGIPGIGAAWALDDFTDVETFYGGSGSNNFIRWSQGENLAFSDAFNATPNSPTLGQLRSGDIVYGFSQRFNTCGYNCVPPGEQPGPCGAFGPYNSSQFTSMGIKLDDNIFFRSTNVVLENIYYDCQLPEPFEYHQASLSYQACPGRDYTFQGGGDIPGDQYGIKSTIIPCWGMIQDHVDEILPYGRLTQLGDVNASNPGFKQVLAWDGSSWSPSSDVQADVTNNVLCDLRDVSCDPPDEGDLLKWNGAEWRPGSVLNSITELPDVESIPIQSTANPFNVTGVKGIGSTNVSNIDPLPLHANELIGFGVAGFRGIEFANWKGNPATNKQSFYIQGIHNTSTAVYTSVIDNNSNGPTSIMMELNPSWVRFHGQGKNWGSSGFILGNNLRLTYENLNLTLENFQDNQVPPKGLILEYIDENLANLDLSNNILENLGNVDTSGKGIGYALVWDGTDWVASPSVAADISLASIGELIDVTKVENTSESNNDGSISFDVGALKTSRPQNTLGGIELVSQTLSRIGWDKAFGGAPVMENSLNTAGGGSTSLIRVLPQTVEILTPQGMFYEKPPSLSDLVVPSFGQVKQQISRQQTDYVATFLLDGNSFTETVFNWPLTNQITSQPNPVYLSKFDGEYSYNFRKLAQDKIIWNLTDGAPRYWKSESLWSFECWFKMDSTDISDSQSEIIFADKGVNFGRVDGPAMGIGIGQDRTKVWATVKGLRLFGDNSCSPDDPIEGTLVPDDWNHLYFANEGSGRHRFYVNGQQVGEQNVSGTEEWVGGLAIGGKSHLNGVDTSGYLTGLIDDFRITRGFVPYTVDLGAVPIPAAPLEANLFTTNLGSLNQLSDVNTANPPPFNGQVLMWNNLDGIWEPGPPDAVSYDISSNQITNLLDVNTENAVATEGDVLYWDNANFEWRRSRVDGNGGVRPINARTVSPGVVPQATDLFAGELFLNMHDKKLYALDAGGLPFAFATGADEQEIIDGILDEIDTRYDRVVGGTF